MEKNNAFLSPIRELKGFKIWGYCFGSFGIMLSLFFTSTFAYNYYIYTLRVDSILISTGNTINMVIGAFTSIIFGVVLDNTKPKKIGKRRPYILIALPLWVFSSILIWFPPIIPPQSQAEISTVLHWPSALWYWGHGFIRSVFGGLMMISFSSVLPEISQSRKNRIRVANISSRLLTTASVINLTLPLIIQSFLEDPESPSYWTPSGKSLSFYMPLLAVLITLLTLILILMAFMSINEKFHLTSDQSFEKKSTIQIFKNMYSPLKDKEYMKFLAANVISQSSRMIMGMSFMPFLIFVIGFSGTQFYFYIVINIIAKYGWLYLWTKFLKRKPHLMKIYKINIVVTIIASSLEMILLFEMDFGWRLFILIISYLTVIGATNSVGLFFSPIQNEIVDIAAEKELLKDNSLNKNQAVSKLSGAYYGLFSFSMNMGSGLISFIYGFIYQGDNARDPIILTIGMASMAVYYIIGWIILKFMKLKFD
ncbi:MAG: MFS transporter [Promethearchaeota archaeon]